MRIIKEAQQGSDAWLKFRAEHFTASDAPAVQGVSPYKTRDQLLYEKKTGITEEVTPQKQALFDRGHRAEANGRPTAEEIIGDELYPAVAECTGWSVLGVSFDGLTMDHRLAWENKLYSEKKAAAVAQGKVPEQDWPQVVQQIHISGAEALLYSICDENGENFQSVWVRREDIDPDPLLAAWAQFQKDLAEYEPPEPEQPEAVGRTMKDLPALHIELSGAVTASNLPEFRETAMAVLEDINTDLQSDQDFADAEETVKWCKTVEQRIEAAKEHALSQTASIDELFKTLDEVREETRQRRLDLDKQVKAQKDARREEIRKAAAEKLDAHIGELERAIEGEHNTAVSLPRPACDIGGAMKGKRTLSSLQSAADQAVADAQAEANQIAEKIRANLTHLRGQREDCFHLFRDLQQIVAKEPEDFRALVENRIREEDERLERIQQEEAERQRREQEEKERAEREAEEKRQREAEAAQEPEPEPEPAQAETGPGEAEEQPELPIEEPETAADQPATLEDYVITIFDDGNGQSVQWNRRTGAVRVMPDGEWMTPEVVQEVA